jgi:hypothetical protein
MAFTSEDDFLRRVVGPDLSARGFDVRYEMTFLLPTLDGGCQQRRADLYITAPPSWEHSGRWPAIAVEGKRRDGGSMGDEIDGLLQTRSCLYGYRFRIGATDYPRPSLALYVDQQTWAARGDEDTPRESMLADRLLWREGAAILFGPTRWRGPRFTFACVGSPQRSYLLPEFA